MNYRPILLVEDNPSDINLTKRALAKSNIANELVVTKDGQEALDYLFGRASDAEQTAANLPSIVLLDLMLPKVDGLSVLRRIKANPQTRTIPVVILTSSDEDIDKQSCYMEGVNSYIRKPVDFNQFVEAVKQLGLYWLVLNEPPPCAG